MGIKCSLFGHDFGETTVERDREEQGNEVVSTIKEVETCTRCGETRVVSENTEVTTIKTPDDVGMAEVEEDENDTGAETEIVDAEEGEPVADADTTTSGVSQDADAYESAAEDDGVILEDDTDEDLNREPGEWPESEPPAESGQDGPVPTEQPMTGSDESESPEDTDFEVVPDEEPARDDETEVWSGTEPEDDETEVWSGTEPDLERAQADVEATGEGTDAVIDGEFRCTECGFSTPVESSSLREGDYCPDCHQGMLVVEAP